MRTWSPVSSRLGKAGRPFTDASAAAFAHGCDTAESPMAPGIPAAEPLQWYMGLVLWDASRNDRSLAPRRRSVLLLGSLPDGGVPRRRRDGHLHRVMVRG